MYENKTGAIHKAYSDILGNICEMELGETTDSSWLIGETCGRILRSMSEPNQYCQPSFEGDRYYCEETESPTENNDQGGVHINSGILGNIAWHIAGLGLSYNEQYWLWTKSNELLTPLSDYDDVCAALMFVSRISGYPQEITDGIDWLLFPYCPERPFPLLERKQKIRGSVLISKRDPKMAA